MNDPTATAAPTGVFTEEERADIELAQAEWGKKRRSAEWQGWVHIGRAVEILRNHAKSRAGLENTNKPPQQWGKGYSQEFSRLLRDAKLDGIDKGTRSNLLDCMDNLVAIETWRATRAKSVRLRLTWSEEAELIAKAIASEVSRGSVKKFAKIVDLLNVERVKLARAHNEGTRRASAASSKPRVQRHQPPAEPEAAPLPDDDVSDLWRGEADA
jgi:hypothetical protein